MVRERAFREVKFGEFGIVSLGLSDAAAGLYLNPSSRAIFDRAFLDLIVIF